MSFDLAAYLRRIGLAHDPAPAPTLDTLRAVQRAHPEAIPFENLDPLLRRPVRLDAGSLQAKLVDAGRGGWCFEHNALLRLALDAIGFRTTGLAARVLWNQPEGTMNARSHMLLRVDLDEGPHVADVGFGGLTLTAPLALVADVAQPTPHETFRFTRDGDDWVLRAHAGDAWRPLYRFDLQAQHASDYELTNWYLCHWPQSHFLHGLIAARVDGDRRHTLRDTTLTTRLADGASERRTLATAAELRGALAGVFRVALPDGPELDAALARVAAASA
jgi:N-hydroxyarylamine O-acetyltransferase